MLSLAFVSCATQTSVVYRNIPWTIKELKKPSYTRIRLTKDLKELLDQAISDLMLNPSLLRTKQFYGPEKITEVALISRGSHYLWPKGYLSPVNGVTFKHLPIDYRHPDDAQPLLGMDIREAIIQGNHANLEFCIFNVGGKNVIGGCSVYYKGLKTDKGWTVQYSGWMDP